FEQAVARHDGRNWENEPEVGFRFLEAAARQKVEGIDLGMRDEFTPFGEGRGALRAAKQWLALVDGSSLAADFRVAGADTADYARLTQPVLLMSASHTRAGRSSQALAQLLPQARHVEVPQSGHFFQMTHPAIVREQLERLLDL
ncbi:MAG TPA: alpha/beta hydrolase, partial [Ramlibacter sp.]|nr:alpha/beta hydrolase [Ramlibacter sp.]